MSAILRLIESVGLRAVVEGIETAEPADQLRLLGCRYGQGHYFSEPVSAHRLTGQLSTSKSPSERPSLRAVIDRGVLPVRMLTAGNSRSTVTPAAACADR